MGIFDFLTPKADGMAYDPMRLPAGADPENDPVVGYDELGQKVRRSRFDGTEYLFEATPPKTQSVIKGAYREATANPMGFTGDLLSNAVQSAWDAISVPRRAMEGQPLTYGDIAGLTGMMTLGAGAGTAPAGALRMGAAREGRPPVTFADAERAMREAPGNFQVTRQDASQIFGAGSERVRYTDPQSNGTIEVLVRPDGSASVLELEVPQANRGQGIGQKLQEQVMRDFPVMGGQVSSKAAATTAYRLGRRPPGKPNATLEDVFAEIDDMSSVNMVSPAMQDRFAPSKPNVQDIEGTLQSKYPDIKLSISGSPERGYTLNKIDVPKEKRESGIGTAIMSDLVNLADQQGAVLKLSPSGDFGGSVPRLKSFYERFGFVQNKGKNTDYAISESMYRSPAPIPLSQWDKLVVGPQ